MKNKILTLIVLVSVMIPTLLFSQAKTGTTAMTFLKIDVSARANALGGAYIGLADDASSLYYNPAGMILLDKMDIILSYNQYLADVKAGFFGVVYPLKELNAAFGVQGSFLTTGEMDVTTPENPLGTPGHTFQASDFMFGVSYAQMLTTKFFVGGTVKFLKEDLADMNVISFAGDVGTYYNTKWKSLIFGMSIRNFGGNVTYIKEESPLPMTFTFGMKMTPLDDGVNKVHTLLEAGHPNDNYEYMILGVEYSFEEMFFLRIGRRIDEGENWLTKSSFTLPENANGTEVVYENSGFNPAGTTLGLGFQMKSLGMKIDYSWEHFGDLGVTHMVTFGFSL